MAKRRVVVTGLGIVSSLGADPDTFYDHLLSGISGIDRITKFDASEFPTQFGAEIKELDLDPYLDKKQQRRVDPFIKFGVYAGKKALEHAGFSLENFSSQVDGSRCGIILSSGMGGMQVFYDGVKTVEEKGYKRLTPFFIPYIITNMTGALIAIDLGMKGPNYSISTACATGNYSIVAAMNHIRNGEADLMVCGGTEGSMTKIALAGFTAVKALSQRNDAPKQASRPWDKGRDGFVMGEGAGVLVLESLEHAQKRGAKIYAELCGGAFTCDAYHMTDPKEDGSGVAECIDLALKDAQVAKERVNYINAHATSTVVGDMCEVRAVKSIFQDQTSKIYINATKSMTGHCLGAASGIEAVATVMAIQTGKLHPTINLNDPEDMMGLNPCANAMQECKVDVALSNSFGFGGHNSTVVFSKFVP